MGFSNTDKIKAYEIYKSSPDDYISKIIETFQLNNRHQAKRLWQDGKQLSLESQNQEMLNDILDPPTEDVNILEKFYGMIETHSGDLRMIVMSDLHIPYHHEPSLEIAKQLFDDFKPHSTIWNGDIMDLGSFSRFPKTDNSDPDELPEAVKKLRPINQEFKTNWDFYIGGNHEMRLPANLYTSNPQYAKSTLANCRVQFKYMKLLFGGFKADTLYYENIIKIFHGVKSGVNACRDNINGDCYGFHFSMCGHGHAPQIAVKTSEAGQFTSIMAGCMCDLIPEYGKSLTRPSNWRNSFVMVTMNVDNGSVTHEHVYIQNENRSSRYYASYGGKTYWGN